MKPRLSNYTALLLLALGSFFILIWSASLYFAVTENFWGVWWQQLLPILLVISLAVALVYRQLDQGIINPVLKLAVKMARLVRSQYGDSSFLPAEETIGLEHLKLYFGEVKKIVRRDAPTGLNNRLIFEDRLNQVVSDSKRSGRKYALVLLEVGGIDQIAKAQGQYVADMLLKQVAERLSEGLRATDNVSHLEHYLFALLLEIKDQDQLVSLVEKKYLRLARRYRAYGRQQDVSIVLGVSLYPAQATSAKELYDYAITALNGAKVSSNPIGFHDEDNTDLSGFTLIQSLRQALDNDEFKLVFQPVVELNGYRTVYLEALLRWKNQDMHDVSIQRTIQLAEKNHLIKPLTNWIVVSVCQLIQQLDIKDLAIGINLSMVDLHDHYLPGRIKKCLKEYGIKPGQLLIEITESQIMQEPDDVTEILSHLGMMGLPLSIDDFGTGQASLTYLKKLPVEKLKIDQSFIRDMINTPDDKLIVKATIELAHTLDLKVIAEGVETVEVQELLDEMNCDYVQGYYISRPFEAEQIPAWYQQLGRHD